VALAGNVVIFGLVDRLLLRPLPVRDPESLVQLFQIRPSIPDQEYFSGERRELIADDSTTLTDVMGELEVTVSLELDGTAHRAAVCVCPASYCAARGGEPALGRGPGPGDDVPGTRLAVLSYPAWPRHFGNDPSVIGRTIGLAGFPYEIVGVLPEGFHGTSIDGGPDVRVLLANRADFGQGPNLRDATASKIIARLRPEASIDSA